MTVTFPASDPNFEQVRKGTCQLLMRAYKDLYDSVRSSLKQPYLTKEPSTLIFDDNTFTLNWCPHILYRNDYNEIVDHKGYLDMYT